MYILLIVAAHLLDRQDKPDEGYQEYQRHEVACAVVVQFDASPYRTTAAYQAEDCRRNHEILAYVVHVKMSFYLFNFQVAPS